MPFSVKGFFEINENMVQILLMLGINISRICTMFSLISKKPLNPGRFGPIPVRSGRFGPGRFGPISGVSRFGPTGAGRFGPISKEGRFGPF